MKRLIILLPLCICFSIFTACSKETKKEPVKRSLKSTPQQRSKKNLRENQSIEKTVVPLDLENKGIGPITSLEFKSIDQNMVAKGATLFKQKCTACHHAKRRMIGPAIKGIYERRSPEWVMNIMLNPIEMLKKDPVAIALLKEYKNVMMINQNLTQEDARALAEYFRTL